MRTVVILMSLFLMGCGARVEPGIVRTGQAAANDTLPEPRYGSFTAFIQNLRAQPITKIEVDFDHPEKYWDEEFSNSVIYRFEHRDQMFVRELILPWVYDVHPDSEYFYMYYYRIFESAGNPLNLRVLERDRQGRYWEYYGGRHQVEYSVQGGILQLEKVGGFVPSNADIYRFQRERGDGEGLVGTWRTVLTYADTDRIHRGYSPVFLAIEPVDITNAKYVLTFSDPSKFTTFDGSIIIETQDGKDYFSDLSAMARHFSNRDEMDQKYLFFVHEDNQKILGIESVRYESELRFWKGNKDRSEHPLDSVFLDHSPGLGSSEFVIVGIMGNHHELKLNQRAVDALWCGYFDASIKRVVPRN